MQRLRQIGMQTLRYRAGVRGRFQQAARFLVVAVLKVNVEDDFADAARFGFHVFFGGNARLAVWHAEAFRLLRHHRQHAGGERGRDQIGRRKAFALAAVINRRVGKQRRATRGVFGVAVQLSLINHVQLGHGVSPVECAGQPGTGIIAAHASLRKGCIPVKNP